MKQPNKLAQLKRELKEAAKELHQSTRNSTTNANIQYKLMELNPELAKQRIKADIASGKNRANVPDSTIDRHAESYKQMLEDIKNEPISEYISIAPQYRIVEGLSEEQVNDLSDDIIGTIAELIYGREDYTKQLLFNPEEISGKGILAEIKRRQQEAGLIDAIGENRWNQIKERAIDKLRTLGVSFEEGVDINDENASQKEYEREAFVVDWKKTSSAAIRFSLATIPQRVQMNQINSLELVFPDNENDGFVLSESLGDYGGYKLVDFSRVFATLMDKLSNTNGPQEFVRKLVS